MIDQVFIFQILIVILTIFLFLAAALVIICWLALLELRQANNRLRGPQVPRDYTGRPFRERI
jgi:hypothetical protein